MRAVPAGHGVERLYESLARFQWWRRRLRCARAGERLAMRKRLLPPRSTGDPPAGQHALARWLVQQVPERPRTVLDVGCGFGDVTFAFARDAGAQVLGITSCSYQVGRARAQAAALGLTGSCRFVLQDLRAPVDQRFDLVTSVETLGHVADLRGTIGHLASALHAGGQILLLEDMAIDASVREDPDARELCARWGSASLHLASDYDEALHAAGLHIRADRDLTAQVAVRPGPVRARSNRRLLALRRWAGGLRLRALADAFLGGVAMERLYAAGRLRYRLLRAEAAG